MEVKITKNWNSYLEFFPEPYRDTYFREEYVKLYENDVDEAVCIVCTDGSNHLIFPFLRRSFEFNFQLYNDFETAYGYGGPIANTNDEAFIVNALKAFYEYCKKERYVAGFVRFHPLLNNSTYYDTIARVLLDRETVAIDLSLTEEEIWMQEIKSKNRNTIKKAISNNLRFVEDFEFRYLDNFIDLYNRTMNKLGADEFFIFDRSYYENWIKNIKNSFLGVVLYEEKVVSAAIFFYSKDFGHYHLSGSDVEYLNLSPNNFMLWEAARSLKKLGVKKFHLGGGSNSDPNNSLLDFKSRFSKNRIEFKIGKTVFDNEIYSAVCTEWENNTNAEKAVQLKNHLLKYKY